MPETTELPDVEALLVAYLTSAVTEADSVGTSVPQDAGLHVRVVTYGGPTRIDKVIDRPIVGIEAWADMEGEIAAWSLMKQADAAMSELHNGASTHFRACLTIGRPYRNDDPTSGRPRYMARYQPTLRLVTTTS